jgi:hypothetical protein
LSQDPRPESAPAQAASQSRVREIAGTAVGWLVGVFLVLAGLGGLLTDLGAGLLILAAAAVVLPPVNAWLNAKLSLVIPGKVKALVVFVLIAGAAAVMAASGTRSEQREAARAKNARAKALRADFQTNGGKILQRMDSALKAGNFPLAVSIGDRYASVVSDSQLGKRLRDARAGQKRVADKAKEQQLLARVQKTSATDLEASRDLYGQLVTLNPANVSYKAKHNDYDRQIRQRDAAEQQRIRQRDAAEQERIRRFGPVPHQYSSGTYDEVEEYLRQVMNDPESLKMDRCTPVYHVEAGWLVGCDYRGRNAFGGMIRQSNWFIIRYGRVVEMKDASAYKP